LWDSGVFNIDYKLHAYAWPMKISCTSL
jgi:hypothetical protein